MIERLFYRYYRWAKKLNLDNSPEYTSWATLSALLSFNILSIAGLFSFEEPIGRLFSKKSNFLPFLIIAIIVMLLVYIFFVHSDKYISIEKKYTKESFKAGKKEDIIAWMYIICTFILFYVSIRIKEDVYGLKG